MREIKNEEIIALETVFFCLVGIALFLIFTWG